LKDSDKNIDFIAVRDYWIQEADDDLKVVDHLFEKRDYSYSLFFGHLTIEKLLKAIYVQRNKEHAPPIHNLVRLARAAKINLDKEKTDLLATISTFNIEARYPDFKRKFRNKCTKDFTEKSLGLIKELYKWLKTILI